MNQIKQIAERSSKAIKSTGQAFRQRTGWTAIRCGVFMLLSLVIAPAIGHCAISIMPLEAQLQVERPGARLTNDIEVYNNGDTPIHVSTSVLDWSMTLTGQKKFHDAGTQPLSCAKWIQVNPVEFSLLPGKSMRVRYSATPPADMAQEHWAMIFFTSRNVPKEGDNRFALNVQTRLGCKVLITPRLKSPLQGRITDMALQSVTTTPIGVAQPVNDETAPATVPPAPVIAPVPVSKVTVTFVNPNPVSVRLNGTVEARNMAGQVVAKGTLMPAKALALVGATRELSVQFDKLLPPGDYQIKAAIDYGGKEMVGGTLKATVKPVVAATAGEPTQTAKNSDTTQTSPAG